jgi:hypothetical protein
MTRYLRTCTAILFGAIWATGALAQMKEAEVQVTVLDPQGKPVSGARVAQQWAMHDGALRPAMPDSEVLTADASGVARGKQQFFRLPVNLMASDDTGRNFGWIQADTEEALSKPLTIRLQPTREVKVETTVADWRDEQKPDVSGTVLLADAPVALMMVSLGEDTTLFLPEGKYRLSTFSFDTARTEATPFTVEGVSNNVVKLRLEMSPLRKALGHAPPPLNVTEAVNGSADFKFESLRGKWVLFEIWGYW